MEVNKLTETEGKALTENIIRNIVSEVLRECKNHHIYASETFIAYYINLLELDPNRELTYECLTSREKILTLVKSIVKTIGSTNDPKIMTLWLQHSFRSRIKELDTKVQNFRRRLSNKLYPLLLVITEQDRRKTGQQLYQKMCHYITLASGLGNPNDKKVFKEVMQVLKSVLYPEEIKVFPSLQNYIKQELLHSLVNIVTGIRLYNKYCKKGGEGMEDLPKLMDKTIRAIRAKLNGCRDLALSRARLLTKNVEKHMVILKGSTDNWKIILDFKTPEEKVTWTFRKDMALAYRQLAKATRVLIEYIDDMDHHRKELDTQFNEILNALSKIVIPTLYQAVTKVFPDFVELATLWKKYQEDAIRLKELYHIFKMETEKILKSQFDGSLDHEPPYLQHWLESQDETFNLDLADPDITIHFQTNHINRNDLEFNGYCCWTLAHTDGVLIPGTIALGVVEYKNRLYAFSSKLAANCFTKDPDFYISKTMDLARKEVYLIDFLNLEEQLKECYNIKTLIEKEEEEQTVPNSKYVQTDTHFKASDIDHNYVWNIWAYRRTVLKNADLSHKITRSTEPDKSYQENSNHTQTYVMADSSTQTHIENYTNTNRVLRFHYGLRGIRENYPFMVHMSQPLIYQESQGEFENKNR